MDATMTQAFTLLNPGPINVSPRVREALASCPDQCHREVEYLDLQTRVSHLGGARRCVRRSGWGADSAVVRDLPVP